MQQPQLPLQQFQMPPRPGGGKAALQYGLIFGGIIGLIDILYSYYLDASNPAWLGSLLQPFYTLPPVLSTAVTGFIVSLPLYVLLLVCFLLAGLFAARNSKRVSTGVIAGLFVGGIYLFVDLFIANLLLTYLIIFPQMTHANYGSGLASAESSILVSTVVYSLIAGLILIGVGALVGALGGLIGRGGSVPTQPYAPYAPNPYQAQAPLYINPQPNPYAPPPEQPVQPGQMPPYPPFSGQ